MNADKRRFTLRLSAFFVCMVLSAQSDPTLSAIREYARNYVETLPNYTAIQAIKSKAKFTRAPQLPPETQTDEVEEQIGYNEGRESHKILKYNGRKMADDAPVRDMGFFSSGEFGGLLETLSRDDIGATFKAAKPEKFRGKTVDVYEFAVPARPAGYVIREPGRQTAVAFAGRIYADAATHAVLRIQFHGVDFPVTLKYKLLEMDLEFAPAKVGGQEFILPARYTLKTNGSDGESSIEAVYRNYQRFSVESTIIVDEP